MTVGEKLYNVIYLLLSQIKHGGLFLCLRTKRPLLTNGIKKKYKVNGTVEMCKTRLVAKGYTQT